MQKVYVDIWGDKSCDPTSVNVLKVNRCLRAVEQYTMTKHRERGVSPASAFFFVTPTTTTIERLHEPLNFRRGLREGCEQSVLCYLQEEQRKHGQSREGRRGPEQGYRDGLRQKHQGIA